MKNNAPMRGGIQSSSRLHDEPAAADPQPATYVALSRAIRRPPLSIKRRMKAKPPRRDFRETKLPTA